MLRPIAVEREKAFTLTKWVKVLPAHQDGNEGGEYIESGVERRKES